MDLDPATRAEFIGQHGLDYSKWGHSLGDPYARPASFVKIRPGEYVIPKMAQDAFTSSNLLYVLKNLGVETIIFIGGHTGACLGRTADSAKKNGFRMICVDDATFVRASPRAAPTSIRPATTRCSRRRNWSSGSDPRRRARRFRPRETQPCERRLLRWFLEVAAKQPFGLSPRSGISPADG